MEIPSEVVIDQLPGIQYRNNLDYSAETGLRMVKLPSCAKSYNFTLFSVVKSKKRMVWVTLISPNSTVDISAGISTYN